MKKSDKPTTPDAPNAKDWWRYPGPASWGYFIWTLSISVLIASCVMSAFFPGLTHLDYVKGALGASVFILFEDMYRWVRGLPRSV